MVNIDDTQNQQQSAAQQAAKVNISQLLQRSQQGINAIPYAKAQEEFIKRQNQNENLANEANKILQEKFSNEEVSTTFLIPDYPISTRTTAPKRISATVQVPISYEKYKSEYEKLSPELQVYFKSPSEAKSILESERSNAMNQAYSNVVGNAEQLRNIYGNPAPSKELSAITYAGKTYVSPKAEFQPEAYKQDVLASNKISPSPISTLPQSTMSMASPKEIISKSLVYEPFTNNPLIKNIVGYKPSPTLKIAQSGDIPFNQASDIKRTIFDYGLSSDVYSKAQNELISNFMSNKGIKIYEGTPVKGAAGEAYPNLNTIYLSPNNKNAPFVLAHEQGHIFDFYSNPLQYSGGTNFIPTETRKELSNIPAVKQLREQGLKSGLYFPNSEADRLREGVADAFALYNSNPTSFKRDYPKLAKYFESNLIQQSGSIPTIPKDFFTTIGKQEIPNLKAPSITGNTILSTNQPLTSPQYLGYYSEAKPPASLIGKAEFWIGQQKSYIENKPQSIITGISMFGLGVGKGVLDTAQFGTSFFHPIQTIKRIYSTITQPSNALQTIRQEIKYNPEFFVGELTGQALIAKGLGKGIKLGYKEVPISAKFVSTSRPLEGTESVSQGVINAAEVTLQRKFFGMNIGKPIIKSFELEGFYTGVKPTGQTGTIIYGKTFPEGTISKSAIGEEFNIVSANEINLINKKITSPSLYGGKGLALNENVAIGYKSSTIKNAPIPTELGMFKGYPTKITDLSKFKPEVLEKSPFSIVAKIGENQGKELFLYGSPITQVRKYQFPITGQVWNIKNVEPIDFIENIGSKSTVLKSASVSSKTALAAGKSTETSLIKAIENAPKTEVSPSAKTILKSPIKSQAILQNYPTIVGGKSAESTYQRQGYDFASTNGISPKQESGAITKLGQPQASIITPKNIDLLKSNLGSSSIEELKFESIIDTSQLLKQPQIELLKQPQAELLRQPQPQIIRQPIGEITNLKFPPIIPPPKFQSKKALSNFELFNKRRKAYEVQIKRRGKFITIGKPEPFGKALKIGSEKVMSTLSQRFRLIEKGTTSTPDISYSLPQRIFTRPKKPTSSIEFVERRGMTLKKSPRGEVPEIQLARRTKSRRKLSIW